MGTSDGVTVRVRCQKCAVNYTAKIPRDGEVLLVPARIVHVKCGTEVKVLSAGIRKLMAGEGT